MGSDLEGSAWGRRLFGAAQSYRVLGRLAIVDMAPTASPRFWAWLYSSGATTSRKYHLGAGQKLRHDPERGTARFLAVNTENGRWDKLPEDRWRDPPRCARYHFSNDGSWNACCGRGSYGSNWAADSLFTDLRLSLRKLTTFPLLHWSSAGCHVETLVRHRYQRAQMVCANALA